MSSSNPTSISPATHGQRSQRRIRCKMCKWVVYVLSGFVMLIRTDRQVLASPEHLTGHGVVVRLPVQESTMSATQTERSEGPSTSLSSTIVTRGSFPTTAEPIYTTPRTISEIGVGAHAEAPVPDGAVKTGSSDAGREGGNMGSRGVVLVSLASCTGVVSFQDLRRPFLVAEFPSSPRSTQKLIISSFPHAPFQITFTHTNSPSIPHTSRMFGVLC